MPKRTLTNHRPGEEGIHIRFTSQDITALLADIQPIADARPATRELRLVLERAAVELGLTTTFHFDEARLRSEAGESDRA
ncbi:hypothetical protein OEIGOIKO_05815 [Streptomyces chrestomyceticus JCM 4735]|uniref:Uncharacterized protein n=1 Tax=Streptomyces chrestomyceticus JCM 4735 TaxID=1306181 RepID=A0A7U9Q133_9ACTN|nr:hypothetical protein [Streptomyces chrestomyceticus]GCD38005.1 hypothetical protein OEIGOIKO_05815 [Streptomyces chrestomyceticus JCM 4735]